MWQYAFNLRWMAGMYMSEAGLFAGSVNKDNYPAQSPRVHTFAGVPSDQFLSGSFPWRSVPITDVNHGFFLSEYIYRINIKPSTVGSSRKEMFDLARSIGRAGVVKFLNLHKKIIVKGLALPLFLGGHKELYMVYYQIDD